MYFISGGMPETASVLFEKKMLKTQEFLLNILNSYSLDFSKHADNNDIQKRSLIWA